MGLRGKFMPKNFKNIGVALVLLILCTRYESAKANVWQSGPTNCYTCEDAAECAESLGLIQKCENNDAQTCLIVFDETNTIVQRGCSDKILENHNDYCESNPTKCPSCTSSGCNSANSLDEYSECLVCDSQTDDNCKTAPGDVTEGILCVGGCMTALYAVVDENNSSKHHLVRSCLNDLDLDDQELCLNDAKPHCKACSDVRCNIHVFDDDIFTCYHCIDDESCIDPVITECSNMDDDQCYFLFRDTDLSVVGMGCASDYESNEIIELIKQKTLYLCDGENCNSYQNLPTPNSCTECNSQNLENCAVLPGAINTPKNCNQMPYTSCYQRVNLTSGTTERGCIADLSANVFYDCLTSADENCHVCNGDACNRDIIPADRPQCQRCNSESDPSCHTTPLNVGPCPVYDSNDMCVTTFENSITKRGCLSELNCPTGPLSCVTCEGTGCNTIDLKRRQNEIYGIFVDLPLTCNTCSGESDCANESLNPVVCEKDLYQDCLSVFDTSGKLVRRGCDNEVLQEYGSHCDSHPELCFNCKSNGCNIMTNPDAYQTCFYCDSSKDSDCSINPSVIENRRKCVEGCLSALYVDKSHENVQHLVRTCVEDINIDERDECTPETNCVKCTDGDDCNQDVLPNEGRLSCLHCANGTCIDGETSKMCSTLIDNDQCYTYYSYSTGEILSKGCRSSLDENQMNALIKYYYLCDNDNCNSNDNTPEPTSCYVCNSGMNEACATEPGSLDEQITCDVLPNTHCYTRITSNGFTERGCLQDLTVSDFFGCRNGSAMCNTCLEDGCNNEVYPDDRQQCYRCNSIDNENCATKPTNGQLCPLYIENDGCTVKKIDNVIYRGCASELSCDDESSETCQTCYTANCNDQNLDDEDDDDDSIGDPGQFQQLPLNCYHCEGSEDCIDMGFSPVNMCQGNILQTCTTAFSSNGDVIGRGCSDSLADLCRSGDTTCYGCKSNGCNTANSESEYIDCIFCDSQVNASCVNNVAGITRVRKCRESCMTILYPRDKDDEYPAYELLRTCLDDLDMDDRERCQMGVGSSCSACTDNKCNTDILGERISCMHCIDDDCTERESRPCHVMQENDQCSVLLNENGEISDLGCKSNYTASDIQILLEAKQIWFCDGTNCNIEENFPNSQECVICSSRTDPWCATRPEYVPSTVLCTASPYTHCYSRILDGGYTERGCLSHLQGEEFTSCLLDDNNCTPCIGDSCNKGIYPIDRRNCHVCDSSVNPVCESTPQWEQACLVYSANDSCVTILDEYDTTIRGCASEVSCDTTQKGRCQVCETDNCNQANLKRRVDGKPGQWQPVPLTCLSCTDATSCASMDESDMCSEWEYCMTVFDEDNNVIARGCSDTVENSHGNHCDANTNLCFNCNSNECNSAESLEDYVNCLYCDSSKTPDCVQNPWNVFTRRQCHKNCMTALYQPENSTNFELVRGCLDDKDAIDQQSCHDDDESCIACNTDACNIMSLPQERLSCYHCQKDSERDCADPPSLQCSKYVEDDQCYMLFNTMSDLVQLGCLSDLDDNFVSNNMNKLHLCKEGDNCNGFENIPTPKKCIQCNSLTNPDCILNIENVITVSDCTSLPKVECYTRIGTDGSTTRGCVSSLTNSQMLSCLSGDSENCEVCYGDRCNVEIFPADRRRCHRCNSEEDPLCESNPQSESPCLFHTSNEFCTSKIVYGHTYRGCSSDFQCDDTDKQYCRMCYNEDNCNTVDLAQTHIGYPGNWQTVPINCHHCYGEECDNGFGPSRRCDNNDKQNCATIFASNGTVLQRSCSDEIYNSELLEHCDAHPELCKFCKSDNCNFATDLNDFVDCIHCDGSQNDDCVYNVENISRRRTCFGKCFTGLYPRNSMDKENPAYEISRSCLDDLEFNDQKLCEDGNKPYCKVCEGESCNTEMIPKERLQCYMCSGTNCSNPISQLCTSFRENDQCYTMFGDHATVKSMGCVSEWDQSEISANRRQSLLCSGDNCNIIDSFPKPTACIVCNSASDLNCAIQPNEVGISAGCDDYPYTQCYTHVDEGGITYRGCLSDTNDDLFDECLSEDSETCSICTEHGCNVDIYPVNRRSCLRCDSGSDSNCENSPQSYASICPIYSPSASCVTTIENDRIVRGCTTDFTCDANDRQSCRICETDNCNAVNLLLTNVGLPGLWQDLPLNCHVCESADECAAGTSIHKCENNNHQICVTVFNKAGTVEARGCSDSIYDNYQEHCDENPENCIACKSNGCNNVESLDALNTCYFCDSGSTTGCSVNFESARTRKCNGHCMIGMYPRSSSENSSYETSRSCLDDMDIDDQEKCIAGENEFCVACEGEKCNTMELPEERHQCYHCTDAECTDIETRSCKSYHPQDQCYIQMNKENTVIRMGCRSDYEQDVVVDMIKQKEIVLCDGLNCNSFELIPSTYRCSVCNSELDPLCATNPNLVANNDLCTALPYTDCFTRVNERGHTIRGCLSSLESEIFYGCLVGSDGLCETCTGHNCNEIDVFPANRIRCHQCNSATDPTCTSEPNANAICPIYSETETCITNLRNGITTRGCGSTMRCDVDSDIRTCRKCNTSGCNTVDLTKVSDNGQPGKWQPVPINCLTCESEEECISDALHQVCVGDPYQNCMTVFNENDNVIRRGCSDSVLADQEEYCDENTGKCFACNSNGCNIATSPADYVECLTCDTDINGDCVRDVTSVNQTRMCYKHCMMAMYPREIEHNSAYGLARSCYDDMDMDDRDACLAGNKIYCKTCNEERCNVEDFIESRLSCYTCHEGECDNPQALTCPYFRADDRCYIQFDEQNDVINMGCRSEFTNIDADILLKEKRLYLCEGNDCNTIDALPSPQNCVICNSRTDSKCAIAPDTVSSSTTCSMQPYTHCYMRVLSDGATERGCLSNLFDDEFLGCLEGTSSTCGVCVGDSCNNEIFPEDRPQCHTCDSSLDPDCEANPNSLSYCVKYDEEETCVTAFRDNTTYRDCAASIMCDEKNPRTCIKCKGSGCNTENLARRQDDNFGKWQDLPLTCWSCKGDECAQEELSSELCGDYNEQDCMTVFNEAGDVVRRGCENTVEDEYSFYCDVNQPSCMKCKSNKCNSASSLSDFVDCLYCDSYKDTNCVWDPNSITRTRKCHGDCMAALYPSDSSSSPGYELVRSCTNDKEVDDQIACTNGSDHHCSVCNGDSCNNYNIPPNRLHCHTCTGAECEEPISKPCSIYKENDQCFVWFNEMNSISSMGCVSSFRNQDLESILRTKRVHICDYEDCNSLDNLPLAQRCASCDSSVDTTCATNAINIASYKTCSELPFTQCASRLVGEHTIRGCVFDLLTDDFVGCVMGNNTNCEICTGDGCNRGVFPPDRLQCYKCDSDEDSNCTSYPTETRPCERVSDSVSCISALNGNRTMRGCSTEVFCDNNDRTSCRSCSATGCNSIDLINRHDDGYHGYWQDLPLRCHTCEGEQCKWSLGPAYTCMDNNNEDCLTVFENNGDIRRRGCTETVLDYEYMYCSQNPHLCFTCKSNECNDAWNITDYVDCTFCHATAECVSAIEQYNTRACHKECMVAMKDGQITRSCLDDKEVLDRSVCRTGANGTECASCTGNTCNNFVFPADRLSCEVCATPYCSGSYPAQCEIYDPNDYCFAKYENNAVVLLGCASSQNATDLEEWKNQNLLYECNSNNCNDLNTLPSLGKCVECDSRVSISCAQNASLNANTVMCSPSSNKCFTRIDSAGHTIRGCASSLSNNDQNSCLENSSCVLCDGEICNTEIFPSNRRRCHICNTVSDSNCGSSISNNEALVCPIYDENNQCVTIYEEDGYQQRGCSTEISCHPEDTKNCEYCSTDACNTVDLSGSGSLVSSILLTALLAYAAIMGNKF